MGTLFNPDSMQRVSRVITSPEILALDGTPITLLAGQGSSSIIVPRFFYCLYTYVSAAYVVDAGDDLTFRYTDGSGGIIGTLETTGVLDATGNRTRIVFTTSSNVSVGSNAPVVAFLNGAVTTGSGTLRVDMYYNVIGI